MRTPNWWGSCEEDEDRCRSDSTYAEGGGWWGRFTCTGNRGTSLWRWTAASWRKPPPGRCLLHTPLRSHDNSTGHMTAVQVTDVKGAILTLPFSHIHITCGSFAQQHHPSCYSTIWRQGQGSNRKWAVQWEALVCIHKPQILNKLQVMSPLVSTDMIKTSIVVKLHLLTVRRPRPCLSRCFWSDDKWSLNKDLAVIKIRPFIPGHVENKSPGGYMVNLVAFTFFNRLQIKSWRCGSCRN